MIFIKIINKTVFILFILISCSKEKVERLSLDEHLTLNQFLIQNENFEGSIYLSSAYADLYYENVEFKSFYAASYGLLVQKKLNQPQITDSEFQQIQFLVNVSLLIKMNNYPARKAKLLLLAMEASELFLDKAIEFLKEDLEQDLFIRTLMVAYSIENSLKIRELIDLAISENLNFENKKDFYYVILYSAAGYMFEKKYDDSFQNLVKYLEEIKKEDDQILYQAMVKENKEFKRIYTKLKNKGYNL
ncbi:MAG: hypothetical protein KDK36_05700 [Leptospiraceae bacterium]|nr:hypothetical protein [Leptospiraceae bacterium]